MDEKTTIAERHPLALMSSEGGKASCLVRIYRIEREVEVFDWSKSCITIVDLCPISVWQLIRRRMWRRFMALIRIIENGGKHVDRSND